MHNAGRKGGMEMEGEERQEIENYITDGGGEGEEEEVQQCITSEGGGEEERGKGEWEGLGEVQICITGEGREEEGRRKGRKRR